MYSTTKERGNAMRTTFIKRRIAVGIIAAVLSIIAVHVSSMVVTKIVDIVSTPTFSCNAGEEMRRTQPVWNIADKYCTGNISDATSFIMELNNIKSKDLSVLPYNLIITIKEKKGK